MPPWQDIFAARIPSPWQRRGARALPPGLVCALAAALWLPAPARWLGFADVPCLPESKAAFPLSSAASEPGDGARAKTITPAPTPSAPATDSARRQQELERLSKEIRRLSTEEARLRLVLEANRQERETAYEEMRDIEARRRELDQRQADLTLHASQSPATPADGGGDALARRRDALRVELATLRESRTEKHPLVRERASELAAVEAALAEHAGVAAAIVAGPAPSSSQPLRATLAGYARQADETMGQWNSARENRAALRIAWRQTRDDLENVEQRLRDAKAEYVRQEASYWTPPPAEPAATALATAPVAAVSSRASSPDGGQADLEGATSVREAAAPSRVDSRMGMRRAFSALAGLTVGACLGLAIAGLRLRWGPVSRFGDEASAQCGLPLLGEIPALDPNKPQNNSLDAGQWREAGAGFVFEPATLERHTPRPRAERGTRREARVNWRDWLGI